MFTSITIRRMQENTSWILDEDRGFIAVFGIILTFISFATDITILALLIKLIIN